MNPDLLLILTAVSFAFLVKGVAGFGGPLLAVPIIAPTLGVEHAVVVVSIGNLISNVMMLWEHRTGFGDTRSLLMRLLSAGAAGTVLGTWLLTRLDNRPLALAVAGLVLGYIVVSLVRPDFRIDPSRGLKLAWPLGAIGGLVHGATGNSGPVFGTFLHSLGLARSSFVFALTVPFLVFGSIQVLTLFGLGAFTPDRTTE
ncbi:MAG: sulfite exporter TauE/SafE family protein, partial [Acidimicrobiia bacterium]